MPTDSTTSRDRLEVPTDAAWQFGLTQNDERRRLYTIVCLPPDGGTRDRIRVVSDRLRDVLPDRWTFTASHWWHLNLLSGEKLELPEWDVATRVTPFILDRLRITPYAIQLCVTLDDGIRDIARTMNVPERSIYGVTLAYVREAHDRTESEPHIDAINKEIGMGLLYSPVYPSVREGPVSGPFTFHTYSLPQPVNCNR